jgi:subtilase family serine protease
MGHANTVQAIEVGIWLKPHNRVELDTLVKELYDPNSSHYHDWLKPEDVAAKFAPTAAEARTVATFLSSHNLRVVDIGPDNFLVRARGTLGDVEKAFHVRIDTFELNGKAYRANTSDPHIEGPAAPLVGSIAGLDNLQYEHPLVAQTALKGPAAGRKGLPAAASSANTDSEFFTTDCFTGVKTESFSGTDQYFPSNPDSATYRGNTYNGTENPAGCGYTPREIWTAYNLTSLYKDGWDGTGQTIVIIDWCGSPTIEADANAFSERFGLPPLNSSNFHIYYPFTTPTCASPDPEINIDVEWAHAIAPGAKIALVIAPTSDILDTDNAEIYAIIYHLGNVISGSYGTEEVFTSADILSQENFINELAAALGISANFATGDSGDFTFDLASTFLPPSVSAPADSPYATAVGGVTLALKSDNTIAWQTGWGNNENLLVLPTGSELPLVFDPPSVGFFGGSGGGPSAVYSKPSFQHKLRGTQRLLPDISWLADPFTGAVIAITEPGVYPPLIWEVFGGTSVSTPMFSGLWAIANQEAGVPLGQAATYLYSMPTGTIMDVLPKSSSTNVTATIKDSALGTTHFSAAELAQPLENTTKYYSALWDRPLEQDLIYVLTFGTDTGLTVTPGWDDVTGLGTPNAKAFADFFNPARK